MDKNKNLDTTKSERESRADDEQRAKPGAPKIPPIGEKGTWMPS